MSADPKDLFDQVLRLSPEMRAALVGSLLDSLDETHDHDAEALWATEIQRRIRQLDDGKVEPIPWAEARRRIVSD